MMLTGAVIVATTAALCGPIPAIRVGGWAMTYGLLLSIGLISVLRLLTDVLRAVRDEEVVRAHRIAHGFGAYWFEGLAIVVGIMLAVGATRLHRTVQRVIGAVVVLVAAAMAAWRISRIGE
jgi:hypothetical protein